MDYILSSENAEYIACISLFIVCISQLKCKLHEGQNFVCFAYFYIP